MSTATNEVAFPKIVFASCNRQNLPQTHWKQLETENPTHFLWAGDAVYTKHYDVGSLRPAFDSLLGNSDYASFVSKVSVDGIWDDHDYGANDAGADVHGRHIRQEEYLRFLKLSHGANPHGLAEQDGLYHTMDIPFNGNRNVKVIFLDTRSFRASHYVRSLGEVKFPLSAIIASAIRGAYSVMGFGRKYSGSVLGEKQWAWLENVLDTSTADMHIIVSSIQMLTSNPVVEGWGHFPSERKRLLDLLAKHNPQRTVLLSGDVHFGEISSARYTTVDDNKHSELVEITSSGLTHTCADNPINGMLCPLMLRMFRKHRAAPQLFYTGKNYGTIEIHPIESQAGYNVSFSVKSLEGDSLGATILHHSVILSDQQTASSHPHDVKFADFPVLTFGLQLAVYMLIFTALVVVLKLYRKFRGIRTLRASKRKKA